MLIAKRVFNRKSSWWRSQSCSIILCTDRVKQVFDIPREMTTITIALYTKPGPQRVKMKLWGNPRACQWLIVAEKSLLNILPGHDSSYAVVDAVVPEIGKSKRKIFYAEVSWEE